MAAFEDMKYYSVNWSMAEPMTWGKDAGCEFVNGKCAAGAPAGSKMFCDAEDTVLRCTSDRLAVGQCSAFVGVTPETGAACSVFEPFANNNKAFASVSSACAEQQTDFLPGSRTGSGSWCLDVESLDMKFGKEDKAPVVKGVFWVSPRSSRPSCSQHHERGRLVGSLLVDSPLHR
ncbi:putative surface protease GP63 [Trypanosoma grayi]|uniref:putative surface protease GP63 n=1 Tax=Trypanosoma grayi TaxID=71804 RepID=UPI0004F493DA|nr:putative surface protease GP63 [Trypanosoma grayi]KEG06405.1 putative surface protease GP63 [Trypanosoma grayi]